MVTNQPERSRAVVPIVGGLLVALFGAFVLLHLVTPFDGARLEPGQPAWREDGVVVTPIEEKPGGLRRGDVVVAVSGQPMEFWAQALFKLSVSRPQWPAGEVVRYTVMRDDQPLDIAVRLGKYPLGAIALRNWGTIVFALVYQIVASYVLLRRPDHRAARVLFVAASSILSATTWSFGLQISDIVGGIGFWLFKATSLAAYTLFWIAGLHFMLIFPRPLPPVSKWPRFIPVIYILPYLFILGFLGIIRFDSSNTLIWLSRWRTAEGVPAAVLLTLHLVGAVWQYRINSDGVSRQQLRWVMLAALLSGGGGLIFYILPGAVGGVQIDPNVLGLIVLPFPLALAVAIVRYNLFDIDTLLNRTLVYGSLTAIIVGFYILIVGSLGALFQARGNLLISLLATGIVAVLFQPLRDWLQRTVNRLMFGERDEPVVVLTRLGRRLEAAIAPDAVLPALVETVAQALKLPYVAITLQRNEGERPRDEETLSRFEMAASYGLPAGEAVKFPLIYQSETIGQLVVGPRGSDEAFSQADMKLLANIAHQAGAAVHAVQLTAALQRSRQRLVTAREEERRRIRRDLHDGLGPALASLALQADTTRDLVRSDPTEAETLLTDIAAQAQAAIADIRRLVYDLRPPALDELGLVAALQAQARQYHPHSGQIRIDAPESLPPLPAAVEVAAYRIAQEAITNVIRHAEARTCIVCLTLDEALQLTITDDGQGLPAGRGVGVGLISMRERAEELGGTWTVEAVPSGGTCIRARLPLS